MSDERVWLQHGEHGGFFHCPAAAVQQWVGMGWEPCDPPEEDNPVTAEMLAVARAAAAEQAEAKSETSRSRRHRHTTTPQE